jgi:hypothetical protein
VATLSPKDRVNRAAYTLKGTGPNTTEWLCEKTLVDTCTATQRTNREQGGDAVAGANVGEEIKAWEVHIRGDDAKAQRAKQGRSEMAGCHGRHETTIVKPIPNGVLRLRELQAIDAEAIEEMTNLQEQFLALTKLIQERQVVRTKVDENANIARWERRSGLGALVEGPSAVAMMRCRFAIQWLGRSGGCPLRPAVGVYQIPRS